MALINVTVKQEPVELPEVENEASSATGDQNGPEFVNIKMEIGDDSSESPNLRMKSTFKEGSTSQQNSSNSWQVPIIKEIKTLPECVVEVTMKEELDDSDSDYYNLSIDESAVPQPTSSLHIEDLEDYQSTSSGRGYFCPTCKKSFANPGNVERHMLLHTNVRIKCDRCNGVFINKIRLEKHIFNKHTTPSDRIYQCDVCEKKFKSSSKLMQHKKIHLVVKPHKCPLCDRGFSFKANLKKHQGRSRCKKPTEEPIMCTVCDKVFEKEYLLKSHLRKHDTDRPFTCEQCFMTFKYKSTLMRHLQLHNGVRPYSCPVCDKSFTHSGLLKPHMRVHTGEKPYQCPVCMQTFAHKHNMERHKLRHERIKHLVCDVCHKQFPKESRLKYHMRTHVNEKHFACSICPKRFSHKQNVLRHYTRKHPGQTYSCPDTDASVALKVWDSIKSKYCEDEAEEILG